jgi:purine nucleoside permease
MEPYELNAPQRLPHATQDNINIDTISKDNRWHGKQLAQTFQESTKNNLHIQ